MCAIADVLMPSLVQRAVDQLKSTFAIDVNVTDLAERAWSWAAAEASHPSSIANDARASFTWENMIAAAAALEGIVASSNPSLDEIRTIIVSAWSSRDAVSKHLISDGNVSAAAAAVYQSIVQGRTTSSSAADDGSLTDRVLRVLNATLMNPTTPLVSLKWDDGGRWFNVSLVGGSATSTNRRHLRISVPLRWSSASSAAAGCQQWPSPYFTANVSRIVADVASDVFQSSPMKTATGVAAASSSKFSLPMVVAWILSSPSGQCASLNNLTVVAYQTTTRTPASSTSPLNGSSSGADDDREELDAAVRVINGTSVRTLVLDSIGASAVVWVESLVFRLGAAPETAPKPLQSFVGWNVSVHLPMRLFTLSTLPADGVQVAIGGDQGAALSSDPAAALQDGFFAPLANIGDEWWLTMKAAAQSPPAVPQTTTTTAAPTTAPLAPTNRSTTVRDIAVASATTVAQTQTTAQWTSVCGSPATATSIARVSSSIVLASCSGATSGGGLLQLSIGASSNACPWRGEAIGAVVGGYILVTGAFVVVVVMAAMWVRSRTAHAMAAGHPSAAPSMVLGLLRVAFPSSLLSVWCAVVADSTTGAILLLTHACDVSTVVDVIVALLAVLFFVAPFGLLLHTVVPPQRMSAWFGLELRQTVVVAAPATPPVVSSSAAASSSTAAGKGEQADVVSTAPTNQQQHHRHVFASVWSHLFAKHCKWTTAVSAPTSGVHSHEETHSHKDGAARCWCSKRSVLVIIDEYRVVWYAALDIGVMTVVTIIASLTSLYSRRWCDALLVTTLVIVTAQLVVCVVVRPFTTRFSFAHAVVTLFFTILNGSYLVVIVLTPLLDVVDSATGAISNRYAWIFSSSQLAITVLGILKQLLSDIPDLVLGFHKLCTSAASRDDIEEERKNHPVPSDLCHQENATRRGEEHHEEDARRYVVNNNLSQMELDGIDVEVLPTQSRDGTEEPHHHNVTTHSSHYTTDEGREGSSTSSLESIL